ncbi:MAG: PspC protein [Glaciihabitans sp.]|jgi:phage shock protein PspC (stress-responsive transcriptional regulator)|nr:PspC protein [Glaciihabitans sp.]
MPKQALPEAETPPAPEPPQPERTGSRFFAWIRSLGLIRQPGWIGGVSAGIADRLGIDVLIVRGILVVIAVLGGPAVLLYAVAWLLLPDAKNRIHLEDLFRGRIESPVIAIAVLVALSLLPVAQGFWWFGSLYWGQPQWSDSVGRALWTIVILGLLVWLVVWFSRRTARDAAAPTSTPATTDDRPDTIPSPIVPAPTAPIPPPGPGAPADEVEAWRESQAQWKAEHEAFRQQQSAQKQAANQAASAVARAERLARAAAYREVRLRTRSNPLYSAALIGGALIAGAITALVLGNNAPGPLQVLDGAAVAAGVLGLGIIVNGALGRRSGGATGVAILLLIPLALAGIFPQSANLRYAGDATFTPHGSPGSGETYVEGTGNVTVDLTSYFSSARPTTAPNGWVSSQVTVLVGKGNLTLIVPEGEYVNVNSFVLQSDSHYADRMFAVGNDPGWQNVTRAIEVNLNVGSGTISIIKAPSEMGKN